MTNPTANRVLRTALFTLVTLAYLSMGLWSPANAYTKSGQPLAYPPITPFVSKANLKTLR